MMNDNFMQLPAVEPSFKRFRLLLRPVASTVKQRVTSQDVSPLAQNMSMAQPAFSALVVPPGHIQLLLISLFFFLGASMQLSPCLCLFFSGYSWLLSMWGVKMSCLGTVQDG